MHKRGYKSKDNLFIEWRKKNEYILHNNIKKRSKQ